MARTYTISEEGKKEFAAAYLLDKFCNRNLKVNVFLEKNQVDLEPVLEHMLAQQYLQIDQEKNYQATEKGKAVLKAFLTRYQDYLSHFDIYCAVDLQAGTFGFDEFWEIEDEIEWRKHLDDERFDDLRVAVAVFKKMDPVQIVFMSFLNEDRFGETETGWEFDLLLGSVWDEILNICQTAIHEEDLAYENDQGQTISGDAVLRDVIVQGAKLNLELKEEEEEDEEEIFDGEILPEEASDASYEDYLDPDFFHPSWRKHSS